MSDSPLSSTAKALLAAAKADGPNTAARAKIWGGVASGAGAAGVVGGAGAGLHAATALIGSGKLLALGALFGSAVTVGVAATLLGFGPTPSLRPDPQVAEIRAIDSSRYPIAAPRAGWAADPAPQNTPQNAPQNGIADELASPKSAAPAKGAGVARASGRAGEAGGSIRAVREDTLMRESALVGEARGALMRGDAQAALTALNATKRLRHRELEPEELSLEAKALRAVGRDGDAAAREIELKARFPEHALAR